MSVDAPAPVISVAEKTDLVQDVLTDCSVVASLCATTSRLERGLEKVCWQLPKYICFSRILTTTELHSGILSSG